MELDFRLKRNIKRAYNDICREGRNNEEYNYDMICIIFFIYFNLYKRKFGKDHPPLKIEQIKKIILSMPDITPEQYPEIIKRYMDTEYKNCDHNVNHFFSGNIRMLRVYEVGY